MAWSKKVPIATRSLATSQSNISGNFIAIESALGSSTLTNGIAKVQGDTLYVSNAETIAKLVKDANATRYMSNQGASNNPTWSQVNLANGVTGTLPETNGGVGQSTYSQGDTIYSDSSNSLAKLTKDTTATRYLSNQGASNNPTWSQINLANGVIGVLPIANGGLGVAYTQKGIVTVANNASTIVTLNPTFPNTTYAVVLGLEHTAQNGNDMRLRSKTAGQFVINNDNSAGTVTMNYIVSDY